MKILSLEASAVSASAAVTENGKVLSSAYLNVGLTHSQTLLPLADEVLKNSKTELKDISAIAVSSGPGSFTGLRIAAALLKGLAEPLNIPCIGVSTLEAMAAVHTDLDAVLCCVMDARCKQVYNALFRAESGKLTRLCADRAVKCEDVIEEITKLSKKEKVLICGDGADMFYELIKNPDGQIIKAAEVNKYQSALGVGAVAEKMLNSNKTVSAENLVPEYLRQSQAERELKTKKSEEKQ